MLQKDSLKSFLESDSKEESRCYADELGIRHYSTLNKAELAEKIANHILSPSVMKKRMCTLTDEQIAEFEIAIRCGNYYRPQKEALERLDADVPGNACHDLWNCSGRNCVSYVSEAVRI